MFFRRMIVSCLVLVALAGIGIWGDGVVMTKDRGELAYNSRNLVRLHIIAHSDRSTDQRIKVLVRDAFLAETRDLFMGCRDPEKALALIRAQAEPLKELVEKTVLAAGGRYGARIETGWFAFPTRHYPFGTLPAGKYRAVRIILGEGRGSNWWCVLFPPVCFLTEGETVPRGNVRVRLLFLEKLLRAHGQRMDRFWRGWARFFGLFPSSRSG
ncbi:MAG: stage II sporulation protein R [Firmicutes bacterium]|nr:stage II sporulation protein R [Bacillota bacterium]